MDLITNPPKESFFNEGISKITKSKYLLDKSIKRMPNYISPIRYKNLKYDINFVYMPIKKIIPQLMSEAVTASILKENDSNVSAYVKENKLARTIRLILYADDFGMVNPIGYAKGRHKILAFYMDIDCPIELRQKSRSIPFVILAERNKNLKSENLVLVLKPFIDELLILQVCYLISALFCAILLIDSFVDSNKSFILKNLISNYQLSLHLSLEIIFPLPNFLDLNRHSGRALFAGD